MTILAPLPVQSFRDSNGNPLAGGLLYTYAAGTSTPQTTYQDVTTGSPNANPIVLNSRGEAQIWLNPAQTYKLVLYDSFSSLIWSVDQVSSAASITSSSIQTQTYTAVTTTGTSTSYVIATNPIQATLVAGQRYRISLHTPNGVAPTLVRDGLAAVTFKVYNTAGAKVAPAAAALPTLFDVEYDGVDYVVFNQLPGAAAGANSDIASLNVITSINGGPLAGMRNRIINGGPMIDQRFAYASTPLTLNTVTRLADMHLVSVNGASTTMQVAQNLAIGTGNPVGMQIVGAAGVTNPAFYTRIAANNSRDTAGKTVAFSMVVYQTSGATQTMSGSVSRCNTTDNFSALTLDAAITFTVNSVPSGVATVIKGTITLSTLSTTGLQINGSYTGALSSGVCVFQNAQFEIGSVATTFEQRPFAFEQSQCQHYFFRTTGAVSLEGNAGGTGSSTYQTLTFPTTMRAAPTASTSFSGATNVSATPVNTSTTHAAIGITAAVAGGFAGTYVAGNTFSAELN